MRHSSCRRQSYATKASTPLQQSMSSPQTLQSQVVPAIPPSPSGSSASVSTLGGGSGSSAPAAATDRFGLLGLLGVIRMTDPDLSMLALGSDLTTLGLNLNAPEYAYVA